jgi:hypothetical protein
MDLVITKAEFKQLTEDILLKLDKCDISNLNSLKCVKECWAEYSSFVNKHKDHLAAQAVSDRDEIQFEFKRFYKYKQPKRKQELLYIIGNLIYDAGNRIKEQNTFPE